MDRFNPKRLVRKTYSLKDTLTEVKKFAAISTIHDVIDLINDNKLTGIVSSVSPHHYAQVELEPQLEPIVKDGARSINTLSIIEQRTIRTSEAVGFSTTDFSHIDMDKDGAGITFGVFQLENKYYTDIAYDDDGKAYVSATFSWFTSADEILVTSESIVEYSKEFSESVLSEIVTTNEFKTNVDLNIESLIEKLFPSLPVRDTDNKVLILKALTSFIKDKKILPDKQELWQSVLFHAASDYTVNANKIIGLANGGNDYTKRNFTDNWNKWIKQKDE